MRTNLTDIQRCPWCGNFLILSAFKQAISWLNIPSENIVVVSGIGCSWKITQYLPYYAAETLHGRAIPFASWVKLANPNLTVVCFGWDGDMYGIGLSHLLHAARRNINLTVIVHNNENYWLTTGQASPTTPVWIKTSSTPNWNPYKPFDVEELVKSAGASFSKQVEDKNFTQLINVFKEAILYEWFAHVDVKQSCPSWKKW
jgi:2-oxoglutarate ferredoxin oxidoreductase subunit beta